MGRLIVSLLLALLPVSASATPLEGLADYLPEVEWARTYGGVQQEEMTRVIQTSDSGFAMVGFTHISGEPAEVFVVRTDAVGDTVWTRTYVSDRDRRGYSIAETANHGFIVVGETGVNNGTGVYVLRIDSMGTVVWDKTLQSEPWANEIGYDVVRVQDGGFAIAGQYGSASTWIKVWLIRIDSLGDTLWTERYAESSGHQRGYALDQSLDGGFIVAGQSSGLYGILLYAVKTDSLGQREWAHLWGENGNSEGRSVKQLPEGGFLVAGKTGPDQSHLEHTYLVRLDSAGDTLWTRQPGAAGAYGLDLCRDGNAVVAGRFFAMKVNENGDATWSDTVEVASDTYPTAVTATWDGGFAVGGYTYDSNSTQFFLIKYKGIPPVVDHVLVDGVSDARNVVTHAPTFSWSSTDLLELPQDSVKLQVGTDSQWDVAEMWNPPPLSGRDTSLTYGGTELLDGETYYLRICLSNGVYWSEWYQTSFRMNTKPGIPVPLRPKDGESTNGLVTLWLQNAVDPESDPLTYEYTGFHDTDCVACPPIDMTGVPSGVDSTGAFIDLTPAENHFYYWWARAYDGFEYGDWSAHAYFTISGAPEAPTAPSLIYPVNPPHGILYDMKPEFLWSYSQDPDPGDTVRYRLEVAIDPAFWFVMTVDSLTQNRFTLPDSLEFNEQYWWRVKAFDRTNLTTPSDTKDLWTWTLGDLDYLHNVTMGDLTILIDHLFINLTPLDPMKTGDLDGDCLVTMSDLTIMIDHLFITLNPLTVPGCQ